MPYMQRGENCRRVGVQAKIPLPLARDQFGPPELRQDNRESLKSHAPFVRGNCVKCMFDRDTGNWHRTISAHYLRYAEEQARFVWRDHSLTSLARGFWTTLLKRASVYRCGLESVLSGPPNRLDVKSASRRRAPSVPDPGSQATPKLPGAPDSACEAPP